MRCNRIKFLFLICIGILTYSLWYIGVMNFGGTQLSESWICKKETDTLFISNSTEIYSNSTTFKMSTVQTITTTQTTPFKFLEIFPPLESKCRGSIYLYVVVISKKDNRRNRENIRKSWASLRMISNRLVNSIFVVSHDNKDKILHGEFIEESKRFQDIHYSHYQDNEESLIDFYMDMLNTAVKCFSAKYYILVHDHTFINLHNIINITSNSNIPLFCSIKIKNLVIRNPASIYYVSKKDYVKDVYPNHCQRNSPIIISADLARRIVKYNKKTVVKIYDVYLFGILPEIFNVTLKDFPKVISHVSMRPHHVFSEEDFGFLSDGEVLPTKIWTKLMINMVLKGIPNVN